MARAFAQKREAVQRGLIIGVAGVRKNLLKIKPPLIITEQECNEVLSILGDAMRAVLVTCNKHQPVLNY